MRLYFDTAYVAKCYINEPDVAPVRRLAKRASGLYSSSLCIAELACLVHRNVRENWLSPEQAAELSRLFLDDIRNGLWVLFPLSDRLLYRVESVTRVLPSDVYLRAGDAIHLVTAQEAGFNEIWTNDRHLLAAAEHFGLAGRSV